MKNIFKISILITAFISGYSQASLNVFTCEPEWKALVDEIGGQQVNSLSATTGLQDPHSVQARPSLIAKIRNADLLVCSGSDLEIGWLPLLLRRSNNPNIKQGADGYFLASEHARILGKPKAIDRSQGDLHAAGNPHIQTSPKNILSVAKALVKTMSKIDSNNASFYQSNFDDFSARWKTALKTWKAQTRPLKHMKIVVHHVSWDYLEDFLKLEQLAVLEDKPGIPPTSGHLSKLLHQMQSNPAQAIIYAAYQDDRPAKWLANKTGIKAIKLPFTIGGTEQAKDLFSLYDDTFQRLLGAINQ